MYSVEDLLISHGYKLPKHPTSSSTPTPVTASSSRQPPSSSPPPYSKHHEVLENRPGPRTVNGYEKGPGAPYGNGGGTRQHQAYSSSCPNNNNEPRDRSQPRQEGESRSQMDSHSLGDSLTSDSGFCDGMRGPQPQSKDVSYWRRRGQDFTVLLDYADLRQSHGGGQGGYGRPEGPQQARGQELSADERQRAAQERQRWAPQAQAQDHMQAQTQAQFQVPAQAQVQAQAQAQAQAHSREREAALHQWRMVTERKCQSLGTDDWHPAVSFGRQLSQNEGERWVQERQRLHARTPEGMVVHPRTKAKSQSLPRMLQPESLQYVDVPSSGQELYRRVNGHPLSHHDLYRAPRWPENGRPSSANQLLMTPKPRFTRPPRPPSYEMHQQIRGSCEVLSGRDSVIPQARDRTPLPISRAGDPQLDYFAPDSGPPGYIPPPSYKRAPIMAGGRQVYSNIPVDYRYRGDVYHQIVAPDGSHWFTRHPAGSWPDPQRERSTSNQKQLYPVYTTKDHPGGGIQYIPFDDPRIRHISSALGGNSLTDADKIRHIRNELPSVTVSEPASDDSAFLPPPLGPFIAAKLADDANHSSSSKFNNDNNRWHSDLHKETVDNFPATDQNCNSRYSKNQRPPPSPSSTFQAPLTRTSTRQICSSDQVFAETITQVKKILPDSAPENNRHTKRRVSETIFCLVSVPVHTPTNINKDLGADQNNNETSSLTVTSTETFAVGLKESPNIRSKSVNEMPIKPHYSHFHTSSTSSMRNYKRAPLRKEIIDAWALQASEDKELCYAGSWPGNQYRNQETQTGSPLKSPEPRSPSGAQEPVQSASDTTAGTGVRADSSSAYGCPMAGQKNLNLSSNSAFSRLSLSPTQPPSLEPSQHGPSSPSKAKVQEDQQPSSPRKSVSSPPDSAEQVAFGQFLLKPVNRRPCDAIGELESINKEMEDTISKRPNVGQRAAYLDGMNKGLGPFKSGAHFTAGPEPGREAVSLPPMHVERPVHIKVRSKSFTADLDSRDMRSVFCRPQANNRPPTNDLLTPGARDNFLLSSLPLHNESNHLYRQDIPVPQESLLRDVGLTVYTETPGGPGEPVQRSLSVPSPFSHKELSQSAPLSRESRTEIVKNSSSPERGLNKELQAGVDADREVELGDGLLLKGRTRRESSRSPPKESSPRVTRLTREVSFVFGDDDVDEKYAIPDPLTYTNESTIADKHLENLLIQEKASTLPAEDLSNLYEVKCAKGIPENESIEQRAARILGISVPVEALGVADKQSEDNQDEADKQCLCEETLQVIGECEQVNEGSQATETEEGGETGSGVDEDDRQQSGSYSDGEGNQDTEPQSAVVLDLPEFPPSKLPLSLPVTPNEKLARSTCRREEKGRGGACKLIESLQDKLNSSALSSAASLGRSTTDRMARLKELDSVSRIRRLSLKGPESGGQVESQERNGEGEESEGRLEAKKEEEEKKEDDKNLEDERSKEEEDADECQNECETNEKVGDPEEDHPPKEAKEGVCEEEIPLTADNDRGKELDVSLKTDEPEGEVELKIVEDDRESDWPKVRDGQKPDVSGDAEGGTPPKPKQRTKLQKPPLLPKPRSVPKREITLPASVSKTDDEDKICDSDSYDPSRVERV